MTLSELCLACGLCCDGTLFRHVQLDPGEGGRLSALGIGTGTKSRREVMWLPCGKLEGRCCTIYDARPGGCRRFICALGHRLQAKALGYDEALAVVRDMQARLEALRAVLPPPPGEPVLRHARACIDSTTTTVSDEQLAAFRRVEELRYGAFMPPPE
ncbi:MAG: YkgJ family cysteine cluster protein [Myxococcota bacterium]